MRNGQKAASKKGNLGITKNYRGITLNVIAAKVYNAQLNRKRTIKKDNGFFNIVAGILQEDTLVSYLFILCWDYILWTSIDLIKGNSFTLKKARSRQYPTETITDTM